MWEVARYGEPRPRFSRDCQAERYEFLVQMKHLEPRESTRQRLPLKTLRCTSLSGYLGKDVRERDGRVECERKGQKSERGGKASVSGDECDRIADFWRFFCAKI